TTEPVERRTRCGTAWQAAGMATDPREERPRVLLRQEVRRWERVLLVVVAVLFAAAVWFTVVRGPGSIVSLLPAVVPMVFALTLLRPKAIELRDTELVLRSAVLTRRIPYT